jgi:HlyD family secretion protein
MRSSLRKLAILGTVLVLSSAVYVRIRGAEAADAASRTPGDPAGSASPSDVAIPVQGVRAERGALVIAVSATGQAEAWRRMVVTAQVGGRVVGVPVRESDAVAAGHSLVVLDPAEYSLAVQEAQASVRDAEAKYREFTLLDNEIPDESTRDARARVARAKSGLELAEVRLRRAQLDLQRTRLSAPFVGRIANLKAVLGQWVRPGDELMTVLHLDPIKVEVQVLESEVGYLAPGATARVSFAAFPTESFTGRVQTINPIVDSGTRTARATVLVSNPAGKVLPGMYARVSLDARRFADRTLVPRSAVLERDRRTMLFVEEDGRAKWRYVATGLQNDSLVEIVESAGTEMVKPGEMVLTDGHSTLVHDARIRRVEDVGAAGGRPR